jgi:hypothetical protein
MNNNMPALIPLQCLKCQSPLPANVDEVAWVCATCGQAALLDESQPAGLAPLTIHYQTGIPSGRAGRPFWVAQGTVSVQRQTYRGNENRQAQEFWQKAHTFFVPAFACSLDELVSLGMQLLRQPVAMTQGQPAPFLPVKLSSGDVYPMAEFIIMGIEAERRDMVKSVEAQLNLAPPVLWILP